MSESFKTSERSQTITAEQRSGPSKAWSSKSSWLSSATWSLPILMLAIILVGGITTEGFLTITNARAVLINTAVVGILAVGMTPITLSGNFVSLAVHQTTLVATMLFLYGASEGFSPLLVAPLVVLVTALIGVVQAFVIAAGLNPVITTLAMGSILYGVVSLVTGGRVVYSGDADLDWLGVSTLFGLPMPVYIFGVFTLTMSFVIDRTRVGRHILLTGANRATAALSGISSRRAALWAFVSLSVACAIGGMVLAAQLGRAAPNDFETLTIDVVAAVLVGGVAIQGGEGSPLRSAMGAVIIALLTNVMLLRDASTGSRLLVVGLAVVVSVSLLTVLRRSGR